MRVGPPREQQWRDSPVEQDGSHHDKPHGVFDVGDGGNRNRTRYESFQELNASHQSLCAHLMTCGRDKPLVG